MLKENLLPLKRMPRFGRALLQGSKQEVVKLSPFETMAEKHRDMLFERSTTFYSTVIAFLGSCAFLFYYIIVRDQINRAVCFCRNNQCLR